MEGQSIEVAEIQAARIALEKTGARLAVTQQEAEYWQIKAQVALRELDEQKQAHEAVLALLKLNDIDIEALTAPQSAQEPQDGPEVEETSDDTGEDV